MINVFSEGLIYEGAERVPMLCEEDMVIGHDQGHYQVTGNRSR